MLRTCVLPEGRFVWGVHRSDFTVKNLRENNCIAPIGQLPDGTSIDNQCNFPAGDLTVPHGGDIYEIPNAFPFKGSTFIPKVHGDRLAKHPEQIEISPPADLSFSQILCRWMSRYNLPAEAIDSLFAVMPEPVRLTLATTSSDPEDLRLLAESCVDFIYDPESRQPEGLRYETTAAGRLQPRIKNEALFHAVANNPHLPNAYKTAMALKPGVQGDSEILGEWRVERDNSHIFEYFRRNSYIPWGHFAANMADDAVRYAAAQLSEIDMRGLRHLYYQRTYVKLAEMLNIPITEERTTLPPVRLEALRKQIVDAFQKGKKGDPLFCRTLWGWNFGFDFSPSKFRMNASHQQIHQQYAMQPDVVPTAEPTGGKPPQIASFGVGMLMEQFVAEYRRQTGVSFFEAYLAAIRSNERTDGEPQGPNELAVFEDDNVLLFVPKGQTSQWELQLMPVEPVGNVLEADEGVRQSLDRGMLLAMKILESLGARLVTIIECAKRFDSADTDPRLLYCFLPKIPMSPSTFTDAQLRWINRHYPEDFAALCRSRIPSI